MRGSFASIANVMKTAITELVRKPNTITTEKDDSRIKKMECLEQAM